MAGLNQHDNPWSAADIETLKRMWEEHRKISYIASHFRRGRNSIVSKVHRLGLSARRASLHRLYVPEPRPPKPPQAEGKPRVWRPSEPVVPRQVPLPPTCIPVLLPALRTDSCRYPVSGEGFLTLFCDDGKVHESYCEYHQQVTHDARTN